MIDERPRVVNRHSGKIARLVGRSTQPELWFRSPEALHPWMNEPGNWVASNPDLRMFEPGSVLLMPEHGTAALFVEAKVFELDWSPASDD